MSHVSGADFRHPQRSAASRQSTNSKGCNSRLLHIRVSTTTHHFVCSASCTLACNIWRVLMHRAHCIRARSPLAWTRIFAHPHTAPSLSLPLRSLKSPRCLPPPSALRNRFDCIQPYTFVRPDCDAPCNDQTQVLRQMAPSLAGSLGHLQCRLLADQTRLLGDHAVWFAAVESSVCSAEEAGAAGKCASSASPLLYFQQQYQSLQNARPA